MHMVMESRNEANALRIRESAMPAHVQASAVTVLVVESPLCGWRLRLRECGGLWEVRRVTAAPGGTISLRRFPHPSRAHAMKNLYERFFFMSLADAHARWAPVLRAFQHFCRGRPGVRPAKRLVRSELNAASDQVATARLIVARGMVAIERLANDLGCTLPQTSGPAWLKPLVEMVKLNASMEALNQAQLDRISDTLLGRCPL